MERLSRETEGGIEGGEGGGASKAVGGRWSTMAVTVLMT